MPELLSNRCGVSQSEELPPLQWLNEVQPDAGAIAGGKGASLAALLRLGLSVPSSYIVTTVAYAAEAEQWGLENELAPLIAERDWRSVERRAKEIILSRHMGRELQEAVLAAYVRLGAPAVAVRSSATAEDLDTASFAGQHDSFLNIAGNNALLQAIRECWASLWTERALRYREERSMDHFSVRMAVIVQTMVQPVAAGVVFTVDPVAQQNGCIYVEAAVGLGEGVVSGTARTQVYRVDRGTCVSSEPLPDGSVLSKGQLSELCHVAMDIEHHRGAPQDVEFAFAGDKLSILQARAITTISYQPELEPFPELGKPSFVDRAMRPVAAERYAMAPRPFDNIVFVRVVGAVIHTIRQLGGVISAEDEAAFRSQVWRLAYRLPPVRPTLRLLFAQWKYLSLLRGDWLAWWTGPRREITAASETRSLSALTNGELFELTDRVLAVWEKVLNERFYISSAMNARAWLEFVVGLAINRKWRPQIMADLMSGLRTPTSEVNDALWELSRLARQDRAVQTALQGLRPDAIPATPSGEAFRKKFNGFLRAYGHREGAGYYVSTPTWERDPLQVMRLIRSLAEVEARPDSSESVQQRYEAARDLVYGRLRFLPGIGSAFLWLVDRLRALDAFRETSHFDITRPVAALQRIAGELSQRMQAQGILQRQDDLFYLTYEESREWCLGAAPPAREVAMLIARRRATYDLVNLRFQAERTDTARKQGELLKGVAASRGVAKGRARITRDERDFALLQPGEVLVCPYSNPAWTPLFISAAAVVSETGGAASHAAIVAREYGIPAVLSVTGAMQALHDGDEVIVDGERGVVQRLKAPRA